MVLKEQIVKKLSCIQFCNWSKILEVVLDVFLIYGYCGLMFDQIVEVVGLLKFNIFYYFDGKEEIFVMFLGSFVD